MKKKQQKLSLKKLKISAVSQINSVRGGDTARSCNVQQGATCVESLVVCETDDCETVGYSCECTIHSPSKTK
ncbi:MAG: hypothetical protein AAF611_07340 [Bacteroidota bacterium]